MTNRPSGRDLTWAQGRNGGYSGPRNRKPPSYCNLRHLLSLSGSLPPPSQHHPRLESNRVSSGGLSQPVQPLNLILDAHGVASQPQLGMLVRPKLYSDLIPSTLRETGQSEHTTEVREWTVPKPIHQPRLPLGKPIEHSLPVRMPSARLCTRAEGQGQVTHPQMTIVQPDFWEDLPEAALI